MSKCPLVSRDWRSGYLWRIRRAVSGMRVPRRPATRNKRGFWSKKRPVKKSRPFFSPATHTTHARRRRTATPHQIPCSEAFLPCCSSEIPCSDMQGIGSEITIASALFETFGAAGARVSRNSLYFSLLSGNAARRPVRCALGRQPVTPAPQAVSRVVATVRTFLKLSETFQSP
jgi:hypothetical protein